MAKLCFIGHGLMEKRHGLLVDACPTQVDGHAARPLPEAHGSIDMNVPAHCELLGRWRIVEADLWGRDYLDLIAPAAIVIDADNHGEISFGAMQAGLDLGYSPTMVFFTWAGFDEVDEITGDGSAELLEDDSIEITFAYHNGGEAILKAKREHSSTAC